MQKRQYGFTTVEIILVVLVVALAGGLGWMFYDKVQTQSEKSDKDQSKQVDNDSKKDDVCKDGDTSASDGVFCAQDVGVKIEVPDAFVGKFKKIDNYEVQTQRSIKDTPTTFGTSVVTYEASFEDTNGPRSMIISKEPLRDFKVESSMPSMFNKDSLKVTDWDGKEAETVTLDGKKFYTYGVGDAGAIGITYLAVIDGNLTVISYTSFDKPGPARGEDKIADNLGTLIPQFKARIESLELI